MGPSIRPRHQWQGQGQASKGSSALSPPDTTDTGACRSDYPDSNREREQGRREPVPNTYVSRGTGFGASVKPWGCRNDGHGSNNTGERCFLWHVHQ